MVKKLPLQNGFYALVDDEDFEYCAPHEWKCAVNKNDSVRVESKIKGRYINLAYFLLGFKREEGYVIKHLNGDYYDFTKKNLKKVDKSWLGQTRKPRKNKKSKYKGVTTSKSKWKAQISVKGKAIYLGRYDTEEEAALAYNVAASEFFGEHAYQNKIGEDNRSGKDPVSYEKTSSNYKGVHKGYKGKWRAQLYKNRERVFYKEVESEVKAAEAYDKKAYELYGNEATLNFPDKIDEYKKEKEFDDSFVKGKDIAKIHKIRDELIN